MQLPAARCLLLVACSAILRNPVPAEAYTQFSVLGRQDLRNWGDQQERQQTTPMLPSDPATLQREFGGIMHTEHAYLAISGAGVLERAGHPA